MQTSPSWSSLNARFHRDRAELTGHWDPRPERNSLLYVGLPHTLNLHSGFLAAYCTWRRDVPHAQPSSQ